VGLSRFWWEAWYVDVAFMGGSHGAAMSYYHFDWTSCWTDVVALSFPHEEVGSGAAVKGGCSVVGLWGGT
jgi:hypothetical protein